MNFLALLGWSPGDDRELMSADELIAEFLARGHQRRQCGVQHREARLDERAVHRADAGRASWRTRSSRSSGEAGLAVRHRRRRRAFHRLLELLRPRAKRLTDFVDLARPFLADTVEYER